MTMNNFTKNSARKSYQAPITGSSCYRWNSNVRWIDEKARKHLKRILIVIAPKVERKVWLTVSLHLIDFFFFFDSVKMTCVNNKFPTISLLRTRETRTSRTHFNTENSIKTNITQSKAKAMAKATSTRETDKESSNQRLTLSRSYTTLIKSTVDVRNETQNNLKSKKVLGDCLTAFTSRHTHLKVFLFLDFPPSIRWRQTERKYKIKRE